MNRKKERPGLARAKRLFGAGRYPSVIRELEPRILLFRESSVFHFLLAASCLQTGDSGGALTYAKRSVQLDPRNLDARLVIAAIALKRGDLKTAAEEYLSILEMEPGNKKAAKALEFMRKASMRESTPPDDGEEGGLRNENAYSRIMLDESGIRAFYPGGKRPALAKAPLPAILAGSAIVLLLLAAIVAKPLAGMLADRFSGMSRHGGREGLAELELRSVDAFKPSGGGAPVLPGEGTPPEGGDGKSRGAKPMTEREIRESYRKAVAAFGAFNDNGAIVEANRLLRSNAGKAVKQKAEIIKSHCETQDPASVKMSPSFRDVAADAELYSGCVVRWKGRLVNLDMKTRRAEFLVGYEAKDRLDGIVPVSLPEGSAPDLGHSLEIFAKAGVGSDGKLFLDALLIRDLAFSGN